MAQTMLERTGEQIAETARKASRATSVVADAFEDGVEAALGEPQNKAATPLRSLWMTQPSACSDTLLKQLQRHSR